MTNLFMNNYTHNAEQAACQAASSSCSEFANLVHAVLCAVCTFVFALAIIRGALGVLISLAIINIGLIGLIIIKGDNRIFKAKEATAVA